MKRLGLQSETLQGLNPRLMAENIRSFSMCVDHIIYLIISHEDIKAFKYVLLVTEFVCSAFSFFFSFACSMLQGKLWELVEFGEL